MSGSNREQHSAARLIGAALVAVIGIALYWAMFYSMGYGSGHHEGQAEVNGQHYASDTANQIDRECGTKSGRSARECITEIVKAEREGQRNESDLAAQWKAADWVMWAGIIAGTQLIATAAGLYYVKRTLDATLEAVEDTGKATKAMERQNELAEETAKRQLRAYVSVTPVTISNFDPPGIISVGHTVLNHGQTPAQKMNHIFGMAVFPNSFANFPTPIRPVVLNSTIFPNMEMKIWHNNNRQLTQAEVDNIILNQTHRFYIWGNLTYRDEFGAMQSTEFYASVGGSDFAANILNLRAGGAGLPFTWLFNNGHGRAT